MSHEKYCVTYTTPKLHSSNHSTIPQIKQFLPIFLILRNLTHTCVTGKYWGNMSGQICLRGDLNLYNWSWHIYSQIMQELFTGYWPPKIHVTLRVKKFKQQNHRTLINILKPPCESCSRKAPICSFTLHL